MRIPALTASILLASSMAVGACSSARTPGAEPAPGIAARGEQCGPDCYRIFNGKDLTGWVKVNCHDDTFQAKDGMIFCTGKPTGFLRTDRMYENYVLEFDWKHMDAAGNSGLFVWSDPVPSPMQNMFPRAVEVQIMLTPDVKDKQGRLLYTGQGDVFSIWGTKMTPLRPHPAGWDRTLPSERVTKGAGEWNHYKVTCDRGTITLEINGHEVSGAKDVHPRKGYICLESEGSPIWFKDMCVKELPAASPALERRDVCMDGTGMVPMFDGRTLAGWREEKGHEGHWKVDDGVVRYDGKGDSLWTTAEYDNFEMVVDWRWTKEHQGLMKRPYIGADGREVKNPDGSVKTLEVEERDSGIYLRGSSKAQINIWMWPCGSGEIWGYRTDSHTPDDLRAACTPKVNADKPVGEWNRFVIVMKADQVTVFLNGKLVIDHARLPGVPRRGPIALQSHGCPIEFENVFVRPLLPDYEPYQD
jgi:Domain of Unknown Function (DUF1080)